MAPIDMSMTVPSVIPEREEGEGVENYCYRLKRALVAATEAANFNVLLYKAALSNVGLAASDSAPKVQREQVPVAPRFGKLANGERVQTWKKNLCIDLGAAEVAEDLWMDKVSAAAKSVWIGHVHPEMTLRDLRIFFSDCGDVLVCELILDLEGAPKGVARVTFGGAEAVPFACSKSGSVILEQMITVAGSQEELNLAP